MPTPHVVGRHALNSFTLVHSGLQNDDFSNLIILPPLIRWYSSVKQVINKSFHQLVFCLIWIICFHRKGRINDSFFPFIYSIVCVRSWYKSLLQQWQMNSLSFLYTWIQETSPWSLWPYQMPCWDPDMLRPWSSPDLCLVGMTSSADPR